MSDRVYIRVQMAGKNVTRELMCDNQKMSDLTYQDVTNAIIEVTQILRHGRDGQITLRVSGTAIEMSFVDALEFVMQAASTLRY